MRDAPLETDILAGVESFRHALTGAAENIRRDLPWIGLADPWAIFVSEVMLQQTSTSRVIEPWHRFLEAFPTPTHCAIAPLGDVLRLWSGLGYPRRAKSLRQASQVMVDRFDAQVPESVTDLLSLPGVGPYTAHAVASFAFGAPVAVLDTNVGRVLSRALALRALRPREAQTLATSLLADADSPGFNQAMLDLGAQYCVRVARCGTCPVAHACRFAREGGDDPAPRSAAVSRPQSRFAGSDRQVRGRILQSVHTVALTRGALVTRLADVDPTHLDRLLAQLATEGLIGRRNARWHLGSDDGSPQ